jgi:hypothetical protein
MDAAGVTKPPIFIVGAPRSGTRLLRTILERHPAIAICGETHFNHYVYKRRRAFGDLGNLENRRRLVDEYLSIQRIKRFGLDVAEVKDQLLREGTSYPALFASLLQHYARLQGKERWGEKTPQHALISEELCQWYPGAIVLHLVRDPRDVVASLQRVPWAANSVMANARTWLACNLAASRSSHRSGYLLVRYETLVTRPEDEVARICAHVDEKYDPCMLVPDDPSAPEADRALGPITAGRLGNWRKELTAGEIAQIEWVAGPHLGTFGYQQAAGAPSTLDIARGRGFAAFDAMRRRLKHLPGIWYYVMQPTKLAREEYWIYGRWKRQQKNAARAATK